MQVGTVTPVTFGYNNELKTLFKKGKLPSVKYDVTGRRLTKKNATLDHVIPRSKGGKSVTENFMLATAEFNQIRGNKPLKDFLTVEGFSRYINQFIDVVVDGFNGNKYIKGLLNTLDKANELGV